jgi:hypothetical protein
LWTSVASALEDLKNNGDLVVTTADRYVIGYLVQKLSQIVPTAILTPEQAGGVHNAINEVCNGIHIDDCEFQTRIGITRDELSAVLKKI